MVVIALVQGLIASMDLASPGLVLCFHADGMANVEVLTQRCCLPGGVDGDAPGVAGLSAIDGADCPGCTDVALPSIQATKGSNGKAPQPSIAFTVNPAEASTAPTARLNVMSALRAAVDPSPPRLLALRI